MLRLLALLTVAVLLGGCTGDETPSSPTASATTTASPGATSTAALTATATPTSSAEPTSTPPSPTPTPATGTGVAGVALVGPSCPVVREGEPCPDKPWQGIVVARRASGAEAGRAKTDAEGRFVLQLPPGSYMVVTLTSGVFPAPASVQATVVAGQITQVELRLDSGIR